jgi:hypothetical protein
MQFNILLGQRGFKTRLVRREGDADAQLAESES